MNVLLTCAGRRNYLVEYFARTLGDTGKVFAVDSNPNAPALQDAHDAFVVPAIEEPGYVDHLLTLCRNHDISLLVPLNDLELPLLARNQVRFREIGTKLLISSEEVIHTCFDKWQTAQFLRRAGIHGPNTYRTLSEARAAICTGELTLPFILKPRWGSASIGIQTVFEEEDIEPALRLASRHLRRSILAHAGMAGNETPFLFQERLTGQEYGLDVINDFSGHHLCTFARRKLDMRAGETDRAMTVRSPALEALGERIGRAIGHVGILDCDVFECDGALSVLEMNPRFGGGYPFTHMAGANVPAMLIDLALGKAPRPECFLFDQDITVSKCDRLVMVTRQTANNRTP